MTTSEFVAEAVHWDDDDDDDGVDGGGGGQWLQCKSGGPPSNSYVVIVLQHAAGWGMGGSAIAADCGVQSPFVRAMGCRYLRCAT